MVTFRFNEIPRGLSEEQLELKADSLGIEHPGIHQVHAKFRFNKQEDSLRIQCQLATVATLTCDRSLEEYKTTLESNYEVVFQLNAAVEREELSGTLRRLESFQNVINITKELHDTVLLSIPVKKLHPRYIKDGKITEFEASFGKKEDDHDPRWDALAELKQKFQKN